MPVIGFLTTICLNEGYIECSEFWDKEYNQKYACLWQIMKPGIPIGRAILCNDGNGSFDYSIARLYKGGEVS